MKLSEVKVRNAKPAEKPYTLTKKQASYSQAAADKILQGKFKFDTKRHIIDLGDILSLVASLRIPMQERILNDFKIILGEVDAYINLSTPSKLPLCGRVFQVINVHW